MRFKDCTHSIVAAIKRLIYEGKLLCWHGVPFAEFHVDDALTQFVDLALVEHDQTITKRMPPVTVLFGDNGQTFPNWRNTRMGGQPSFDGRPPEILQSNTNVDVRKSTSHLASTAPSLHSA